MAVWTDRIRSLPAGLALASIHAYRYAVAPWTVPVRAELLRVRRGGDPQARRRARRLARREAPRALPPVGLVRLRPRSGAAGPPMTLDMALLDILVCPVTRLPLKWLPAGDLERLNRAIVEGEAKYRDGSAIDEPVTQ